MESKSEKRMMQKSIGSLRADIRKWRRTVASHARADGRAPGKDAEYVVLHGRIVNTCRDLAGKVPAEDARREVLVRIDDLVRPWLNPRALKEAPRPVVADLLVQGEGLEMELVGKQRSTAKRVHMRLVAAAAALLVGFLLVLTVSWWSSGGWLWLDSVTAGIADRIRRSSFTEQFAAAVFLSWVAGTWLISAVYKS